MVPWCLRPVVITVVCLVVHKPKPFFVAPAWSVLLVARTCLGVACEQSPARVALPVVFRLVCVGSVARPWCVWVVSWLLRCCGRGRARWCTPVARGVFTWCRWLHGVSRGARGVRGALRPWCSCARVCSAWLHGAMVVV